MLTLRGGVQSRAKSENIVRWKNKTVHMLNKNTSKTWNKLMAIENCCTYHNKTQHKVNLNNDEK